MPQTWPRAPRRRTTPIVVGLALATLAAPAMAALGGNIASVQADGAHMAAQLKSTAAGECTIHTLTRQNGTVSEYARADGLIFAVTWHGPARADLRQLLGDHFDTFQTDNAVAGGRRPRRPLVVNRSDFVVRTGGHSGAFWGVATLPQSAPSGCTVNPLQ